MPGHVSECTIMIFRTFTDSILTTVKLSFHFAAYKNISLEAMAFSDLCISLRTLGLLLQCPPYLFCTSLPPKADNWLSLALEAH